MAKEFNPEAAIVTARLHVAALNGLAAQFEKAGWTLHLKDRWHGGITPPIYQPEATKTLRL